MIYRVFKIFKLLSTRIKSNLEISFEDLGLGLFYLIVGLVLIIKTPFSVIYSFINVWGEK